MDGENAIHKAADILNRLNAYEPATVNVDGLDYREGLNATLISGGKGTNVIPDECRVHVNYRFAPDKSLAEAKALMMGADAGAELGNGEHVATGGVFEGYGIEMKDESPSARPGLNAPLAGIWSDWLRSALAATRWPSSAGPTWHASLSSVSRPSTSVPAIRCWLTSTTSRCLNPT